MTNLRSSRYGQLLGTILSRRNKTKNIPKNQKLQGTNKTEIIKTEHKKIAKNNRELEYLRFEYKKLKRKYSQLTDQRIAETTLRKLRDLLARINDQEHEKSLLTQELSELGLNKTKTQTPVSIGNNNQDKNDLEDEEIEEKKKKIEKLTQSIKYLKSNKKDNLKEKVNSKQAKLKELTNNTNDLLLDLNLLKEDLQNFQNVQNAKQTNKEDEEKSMIQERILKRIREQYSQQERKAKKIGFEINNLKSMNKTSLQCRQTIGTIKMKCKSIKVENEKLQMEIGNLQQLKETSENKTILSESDTSYSDFSNNHRSKNFNNGYNSDSNYNYNTDTASNTTTSNNSDSNNSYSMKHRIQKRNRRLNLKKSPTASSKGIKKLKFTPSLSTKTIYHRTISEITETVTRTDSSESLTMTFSDSCNSEQDFENKITRFEGNDSNNEELWNSQASNKIEDYSNKKTKKLFTNRTPRIENRIRPRSNSISVVSNVHIKLQQRTKNNSEDTVNLSNKELIDKYKLLKKQSQQQKEKQILQKDKIKTNEKEEKQQKIVNIPSLQVLLTIPKGVAYFKEFLCVHLNQENLLFFQSIKDYKANCQTQKQINKEAKKIIKKYIVPGSIFEINIESKTRQKILKLDSLNNYSTMMFDHAQITVYNHMNLNSWEPFIETKLFKILLKELMNDQNYQQNPNVKKSKLIYPIKKKMVLNEEIEYLGKYYDAEKLSAELLNKMIQILMTFYKISSNNINLQLVFKSLIYRKFVQETLHLQRVRLNKLSEQQKLCFFINIYNLLFLQGLINYEIPRNRNEIKKFKQKCCYKIGENYYSLSDIYHGILRADSTYRLSLRNQNYFKKSDTRNKISLKKIQPQFHFALINFHFNIPLQIFTSNNIEQNLKLITQKVLIKLIKLSNGKLLLPNIFKLYEKDFGGIKNILNWIKFLCSNNYGYQNNNNSDFVIKFTKNTSIIPNFTILTEKLDLKNRYL
ncbi:electron carrier/ protein disulfide oxidoreductase [Anaeramoeba flamelloides]|uniref:Electron carrier/ protein disulfide oxidoreductase n=1 Tax=Anaeramoeba flamelloides TaxID=1746091 RepID=A0AAV7Y6W2_9EUKA|nr:electron carrier/ protein disulfide oxidoreductase [Anaeramoeba flamelloides]